MLTLNFFFLPPAGTFTIADPQHWVALVAFLILLRGLTLNRFLEEVRDAAVQVVPLGGVGES
jgi:two-component system sensor histidine kinase KdpD